MSFIKDNGGVLAVLAVAFVVMGAFADWRISVKIDEMMEARGLVKAGDVAALKDALDELKDVHDRDTDEWKRRVERIVDILLEE